MRRATITLVATLGAALTIACGGSSAPTWPSGQATVSTTGLEAFVGTWRSGGSSVSGSAGSVVTPDACSQLDYQVAQSADGKSATVQFNGTCAGITAKGTGSGSLSGTVLTWNAQGTAVRGSLICPFSFDNSTATREGAGIRVNYAGSVCGVPVRGSELLVR